MKALASCLVTFGLLATVPSFADDLNPPAYRGQARSTSAEWDFRTAPSNPNKILPDGEVPLVEGNYAPTLAAAFPGGAPYPSGTPFGPILYSPFSGGGWLAGGSQAGIAFHVPNWIDQEPEKRLRVQVTYKGKAPGIRVFGFLGVSGGSTVLEVLQQRIADTSSLLPAGADYFLEDWKMFPNPDWEQVVVDVPQDTTLLQVVIDTVSLARGECRADEHTLCLLEDRFQVNVDFRTAGGPTQPANVALPKEGDSGLFYFFSPNNWEMLLKVLDGCGLNNRYWVFAAATTNVEYTITVTDTQTNAVKTYFNPLGRPAAPIQDTQAFATCP